MEIFLVIISIFLLILTIYAFSNRKKVNQAVQKENQKLEQTHSDLIAQNINLKEINSFLSNQNTELTKETDLLKKDRIFLQSDIDILKLQSEDEKRAVEVAQAKINAARQELDAISKSIHQVSISQKELANQAFSSYCEALEEEYCKKDKEFLDKMQNFAFSIQNEQNQLEEIKATRAAAQQALLKEQEIKENKDNYRLIPTQSDLEDIRELERVKKNLHKPRILSMLIWQTYWQPLSKIRFPIILQDKTKCGIYKITNIHTNEAYIGQSVDVYKRWSDHCKCGLGIDTPPGNKLYKAIQDYGLDSFTFELLAECPKEELDAKERYFIELYQAKDFGYNGRTQ